MNKRSSILVRALEFERDFKGGGFKYLATLKVFIITYISLLIVFWFL